MIASFHMVEYRKRAFSPPAAGAAGGGAPLLAAAEHRRRLRLVPRASDPRGSYRRLRPDLRRWAFYGVWDNEAALNEFLAASEGLRAA